MLNPNVYITKRVVINITTLLNFMVKPPLLCFNKNKSILLYYSANFISLIRRFAPAYLSIMNNAYLISNAIFLHISGL